MSDEVSEQPRRRRASAETMAGREAARFVRELNRQLGVWQSSSVKLYAMAGRMKLAGHPDASIIEQARALYHLAKSEAQRFESQLLNLPEAVACHGRVIDTRRSFQMVMDRLAATLAQLGAEPQVGGGAETFGPPASRMS